MTLSEKTTHCKRFPRPQGYNFTTELISQKTTSIQRGVLATFMYPIGLPEQVKREKIYSGSWGPWLLGSMRLGREHHSGGSWWRRWIGSTDWRDWCKLQRQRHPNNDHSSPRGLKFPEPLKTVPRAFNKRDCEEEHKRWISNGSRKKRTRITQRVPWRYSGHRHGWPQYTKRCNMVALNFCFTKINLHCL